MQTDDVLILLQDVAEEIIKPRFRTLAAEEIAEKNPGDLVTVADREAEVRITEALLRAYPDALVLGEEASVDDPGLMARFQAADHAFTVDPVDGTKNFVHGSPDHAVMVEPRWRRGAELDLAAAARDRLRGGARGRRLGERPAAAPAAARRRPAWSHRAGPGSGAPWGHCGRSTSRGSAAGWTTRSWSRARPTTRSTGEPSPGTTHRVRRSPRRGFVGTFDGSPYRPRLDPLGLIAAADRATYDLVHDLVDALPGL